MGTCPLGHLAQPIRAQVYHQHWGKGCRIEWRPPKDFVHVLIPRTVNVTSFEKRLFVDIIKLMILKWGDHARLFAWAPNPMISALIRDTQRRTQMTEEKVLWRWRQRSGWCSLRKPRTAGRHQKLEEARSRLSLRSPIGSVTLLKFGLLVSRVVKKYIFVVLRHQVSANLLQQS